MKTFSRAVLSSSLLVLILSGCAVTRKAKNIELESNLRSGNTQAAILLAKNSAEVDDEDNTLDNQHWGMQSATLFRMDRQFRESNRYFDLIEDVMYQEDTEGFLEKTGETIGSIITNDSFLDYEQTVYDSIMINTYKALNFIAEGDFSNARVEWNRADDRQRRAADYFAEKINEKKEEIAEKAEERRKKKLSDENYNDGDIDKSISESNKLLLGNGINMSEWDSYQGYVNPFATYMHGLFFMLKAQDGGDLGKSIDSLKRVNDLTNTTVASESLAIAKALRDGKKDISQINKVWVVFENGRAMKKEEMRVDLPLFIFSDKVTYTGIALPKLKAQHDHFKALKIGGVETEVISDMDKIIKAEFKEEFPLILSREITRVTIKTILQKKLQEKNPLLGMGAGLLQAASTNADLRTWSLLPKNFQAAIVDKPKDNILVIESEGLPAPITVELPENKNAIVYIKAINSTSTPTIDIMTL